MNASGKKAKTMESAENLRDEVMKFGRNVFLFGLGTVATAEEGLRDLFGKMVAKGEDFEKDAGERQKTIVARATGTAKELGRKVEDRIQGTVSGTLARAGIPSRAEIRRLIERVETLTEKVEKVTH